MSAWKPVLHQPTLSSPAHLLLPVCLRSLQRSLVSIQEGPDGHLGGLLTRGRPPLQLHGRRPAAHLAVPPSLHQRLPQADPGGVRLQADLLLPVSEPGACSEETNRNRRNEKIFLAGSGSMTHTRDSSFQYLLSWSSWLKVCCCVCRPSPLWSCSMACGPTAWG